MARSRWFKPHNPWRLRLRWAVPSLLAVAIFMAAYWWLDRPARTDDVRGLAWQLEKPAPATVNPQPADEADPEASLRRIFEALESGQRGQALELARSLVERHPNFQLAQLVYADLLNIELPQPVNPMGLEPEGSTSLVRRAQELVTETLRRIEHPPLQALRGKVPKGVHLPSQEHRYVAAVDASKSRIYWFANRPGPDGASHLELIHHSYVSVGVNGMGKFREGDGKTPLGVYFIQRQLPGAKLPDLFGAGALTLNYPNAIDVMRNKTGSGIWLHGSPSAQYSRAPLATDGCVVLPNSDMRQLLDLPGIGMTPVLIAQQLEWVDQPAANTLPAGFSHTLQEWLSRRGQGDANALAGFYSPRFEREDLGLDHWWPILAREYDDARRVAPLAPVSMLSWHDEESIVVATLSPPSRPAGQRAGLVRTYWRLEGDQWKIVFEGPA
jgi:hypothetical protein